MQDWILEIMEKFGYSGVLMMMALENVFPPIPSEIILLFGGFMTTQTNLTILGMMITATTGSILGAITLYGVGRLISVERMEMMIDRWGKVIRLKRHDLQLANSWFEKHGYLAVFLGRMVPIVRSLISIPAGISGIQFWKFLLFTLLGTLIWNTVLVTAGAMLGESWTDILVWMSAYSMVVYLLIIVGAILFIIWYFHSRKKNK